MEGLKDIQHFEKAINNLEYLSEVHIPHVLIPHLLKEMGSAVLYNAEVTIRKVENDIKATASNQLKKLKDDNPGSERNLASVRRNMLNRCYNQNHKAYHRYGGRGILVCPEWITSFDSFYKWAMGAGYEFGLQLDRTDNDGGYSPENCRWVSCKKNIRNSTVSKLTKHCAEAIRANPLGLSTHDLAKAFDVKIGTIESIRRSRTWRD